MRTAISRYGAGGAKRAILTVLLVLACCAGLSAAITVDANVSKDNASASASISTPSFSTKVGNELLLAFVATDYLSGANTSVSGVSGGGLTWALVKRTNVQSGTAEIWRAFAPTPLSNVAVQATLSQSVVASITVMSYAGVDPTGTDGSGAIGATGSGNANPGAPIASLTTTRNSSWVFGVGNDFDNAIPRTPGSGQSLVHQHLTSTGDTYWVQMQNSATPARGTHVTINDTAPTGDRYNLSIVEMLPALVGPAYTVAGSINPAALGTGAVINLLQNGQTVASATADSSGNYSFLEVQNGSYAVIPSKSGVVFSPASATVTVAGANVTGVNFTSTPGWTISGMVSPATSGAGTLMTLTGTSNATATVDGSGNYSLTVANGTYTLTPSNSGFTFSPANQKVTVNGANVSNVNFVVVLYPDLSDIIPSSAISVVPANGGRQFQYTHDTFNGGPGPLVIQPAYNPASGTYQGTQYIYTLSSGGSWSVVESIPIAGAFVFDPQHGHFHFPFVTYGLYTVAANGGPGTPVATSGKISFCINDSFIYNPSLPNAGAIGNLGSCSDPTSLRGLDIGAVDEYDQTDEGQSIDITGVPDGTYWLRAIVDPDNFLAEANKANNETDVEVQISGTSVQVLQTVTPTLPAPPSISVTAPSNGTTVSGTVPLTAGTATTSGVQFLIDGEPLGNIVQTQPYTINWNTTTVPNGIHWLAAQTTGTTGVTGTSAVVSVTVSNVGTSPPQVTLTSPTAGSTVDATVTVSANAAGSESIASVVFYVDNSAIGTVTAPPYMIFWNTETVAAGQHKLTATATDITGNVGTSAPVSVIVDNSHPPNQIGEDLVVSVDGRGTMTTASFSTSIDGELLVAFVSYDGPPSAPQTATVSGGGLTWTLVKRSNTQSGTAEIWAAIAPDTPFSATVTSQSGTGGSYDGSLTVVGFTNAAGPGIVGRAGAPSGAPDIYLPGISAGNWVFAVGNDWDNAIARTPVSGQVLVHQRVDTQVGDTYWVQATTAPSTTTGLVDIHDSAPTTDRWNYAAVEIVATRQ